MKKKWLGLIIICVIVVVGVLLFVKQEPKESALTDEKIVVKIWDWGVSQQKFYDEQFEKFMKENPNIIIEHSAINVAQYDSMLQLAIKSKNGPDIFWKPNSLSNLEMIEKGWVQPIDEFVDEQLKALYPPEAFNEGLCVFNGKFYSFPLENTRPGKLRPLYWNKKLFAEAGLAGPPKTWSQLREYAKKITASGAGKYYGYILGGKNNNTWAVNVAELAAFAGNYSSQVAFDYRTGKFHYDHPTNIAAFQLLLAMNQDGSIFPGVMSIDDEQARAYFATNKAAMIIGGPWNVSGWAKYTNLDYGVAPLPLPDAGMTSKLIAGPPVGAWWMKKDPGHPSAVAKVLEFMASFDFHQAFNREGIGFSIMEKASDAIVDPHMKEIAKIASQMVIIGPSPVLKNPMTSQIAKFEGRLPSLKESFPDILMKAWTNNGKGIVEDLKRITQERNKLRDEAIKLAQKEGVNIKASDFVFPDFNPIEDYTIKGDR